MDLSALSALTSSLNALKDISGALTGLRDFSKLASVEAQLKAQLIDALTATLNARQFTEALESELLAAKDVIAKMQRWEEQSKCYCLQQVGTGTYAYAVIPAAPGDKPPHYFCPNCYAERKLLPLQRHTKGYQGFLKCHACGLDIEDGTFETPGFA